MGGFTTFKRLRKADPGSHTGMAPTAPAGLGPTDPMGVEPQESPPTLSYAATGDMHPGMSQTALPSPGMSQTAIPSPGMPTPGVMPQAPVGQLGVSPYGETGMAPTRTRTADLPEFDPGREGFMKNRLRQEAGEKVDSHKKQVGNYHIKSLPELLAAHGGHENDIRLGRGMFGQAYLDQTHKGPDGNPVKAAVKYGVIHGNEMDIAKEMGELGIGPIVYQDHLGQYPIDSDDIDTIRRQILAARRGKRLSGRRNVPRPNNPDKMLDENHPDAVPDHEFEKRKKNFGDHIEEEKKFIEQQLSKLDDNDPMDQDTRMLWNSKLKELNGIDPGVIQAVSEAGLYHTAEGLDVVRGLADISQHSPQDFRFGSRMAMEYLDDYAPVNGHVNPDKPIESEEDAEKQAQLSMNVLDTISKLHGSGHTHNDIHGYNMMYDKGTGGVKLIDFGLAEKGLADNSSDWELYPYLIKGLEHALNGMVEHKQIQPGEESASKIQDMREDIKNLRNVMKKRMPDVDRQYYKVNNPQRFVYEMHHGIEELKDKYKDLNELIKGFMSIELGRHGFRVFWKSQFDDETLRYTGISAQDLLAQRKHIIRTIQTLDPDKDIGKIIHLRKQAAKMLKMVHRMGESVDVKDAYALAMAH